jgi:acetate kinase
MGGFLALHILTLNAGSSSLKFAAFDARTLSPVLHGQVAGIGSNPCLLAGDEAVPLPTATSFKESLALLWQWLESHGYAANRIAAIGHRIVHGGTIFLEPTIVDDGVQKELDGLRALAPLHLPFGLGVLKEARTLCPDVPSIACFDTAFHATQPELATRLPLPRSYHDRGYRRYGFHGLNYEHVVNSLPDISKQTLPRRLLAAHLGFGASMCAIVEGRSIATTMGFSTADGLVMGTRSGSIDPGVLITLMRDEKMGPEELEDLLYRRSGLLGLSGFSSDMRTLLASDLADAKMAVDYYCYSAARYAGSLIVAMRGVDAIVFTGGIGENAAPIRQKIMAHLAWLNIGAERVFVVPANEELTIARHVAGVLKSHH